MQGAEALQTRGCGLARGMQLGVRVREGFAMRLSSSNWFYVGALLAMVGCNNEVTTPTTAPLALIVSTWDPEAEALVPVEGVQLCELATINCQRSDAKGRATIQVPFGEEINWTLTKEGYTSWLVADVIPATGVEIDWPTGLVPVEQYQRLDSPYPMRGMGRVAFELDPPIAGATAELVGATGKQYYEDDDESRPCESCGSWSLDLTETTSVGRGGFVEVGPGEFQLKFGGSGQTCRLKLGLPGDTGNSVRFQVREGYASFVAMYCPP
jgi:hypothetical protein